MQSPSRHLFTCVLAAMVTLTTVLAVADEPVDPLVLEYADEIAEMRELMAGGDYGPARSVAVDVLLRVEGDETNRELWNVVRDIVGDAVGRPDWYPPDVSGYQVPPNPVGIAPELPLRLRRIGPPVEHLSEARRSQLEQSLSSQREELGLPPIRYDHPSPGYLRAVHLDYPLVHRPQALELFLALRVHALTEDARAQWMLMSLVWPDAEETAAATLLIGREFGGSDDWPGVREGFTQQARRLSAYREQKLETTYLLPVWAEPRGRHTLELGEEHPQVEGLIFAGWADLPDAEEGAEPVRLELFRAVGFDPPNLFAVEPRGAISEETAPWRLDLDPAAPPEESEQFGESGTPTPHDYGDYSPLIPTSIIQGSDGNVALIGRDMYREGEALRDFQSVIVETIAEDYVVYRIEFDDGRPTRRRKYHLPSAEQRER